MLLQGIDCKTILRNTGEHMMDYKGSLERELAVVVVVVAAAVVVVVVEEEEEG